MEGIPAQDQLKQRREGLWWPVRQRGAGQFGVLEPRCRVDLGCAGGVVSCSFQGQQEVSRQWRD